MASIIFKTPITLVLKHLIGSAWASSTREIAAKCITKSEFLISSTESFVVMSTFFFLQLRFSVFESNLMSKLVTS